MCKLEAFAGVHCGGREVGTMVNAGSRLAREPMFEPLRADYFSMRVLHQSNLRGMEETSPMIRWGISASLPLVPRKRCMAWEHSS